MALRMVEIFHPSYALKDIEEVLSTVELEGVWSQQLSEEHMLTRVLVPTEECDSILDRLARRCEYTEDFRIVLLGVEATLPKPKQAKTSKDSETNGTKEEPRPEASNGSISSPASKSEDKPAAPKKKSMRRIAKAELMADLDSGFEVNRLYITTVILSAIVAAVGLMQGSVAVLVGAMVIAPLLGPNMALSLATTLGDVALIKKALTTNLVGFLLALVFAVALGLTLDFDITQEIEARTQVRLSDLVLALSAGAAGALSCTSGVSANLVGVMVAVALMPPLVVSGLYLGLGNWNSALGAMLLVAANVICINLSSVVTFALQGIRPHYWFEAERAKRSTTIAIIIWASLLAALAAVFLTSR